MSKENDGCGKYFNAMLFIIDIISRGGLSSGNWAYDTHHAPEINTPHLHVESLVDEDLFMNLVDYINRAPSIFKLESEISQLHPLVTTPAAEKFRRSAFDDCLEIYQRYTTKKGSQIIIYREMNGEEEVDHLTMMFDTSTVDGFPAERITIRLIQAPSESTDQLIGTYSCIKLMKTDQGRTSVYDVTLE